MNNRTQTTNKQHVSSSGSGLQTGLSNKNLLEWTVFGFSLVLVLTLIGYLLYQTITYKSGTPDLSVRYIKDPSTHNPNRYRIIIANNGGETAEEVKIEAALIRAGAVIEKAELGVTFSPKLSEREGWANFSQHSFVGDSVAVRIVSYKKP